MNGQPEPISVIATAKMSSARIRLADLALVTDTIGEAKRTTFTWAHRTTHTVTGSSFSAQSPSINVIRTYAVESLSELVKQAPRGKIHQFKARFELQDGVVALVIGESRDLSRDLILTYEAGVEDVPTWFQEIVKRLISERMLFAAIRELVQILLVLAPIIALPVLAPWAVISWDLTADDGGGFLLVVSAIAWLVYATFAPTLVRFVRASSVRVRPLVDIETRVRYEEVRMAAGTLIKSGWLAFRHSDHQFNAVLLALMALIVSVVTLVVQLAQQ